MNHAIYFLSYASFATVSSIVIAWGQYVRYKREGIPFNFTLLLLIAGVAMAMWTGAGLTIFAYEPSNKSAGFAAFFLGISLSAFFAWQVNKTVAKIQRDRKIIDELSKSDALTGMLNLRVCHEVLKREFVRSIQFELTMSVVMFSLDGLTDINKKYGFTAGDLVLKEVGNRFAKSSPLRSVDTSFRWKSDKFTLILPRANLYEAKDVVRKVQHYLSDTPFNIGTGTDINVTFSLGIASFTKPIDMEDTLLINARHALDAAKKNGGNCIYYFTDDDKCEQV